jgi:PAP2 superfamily
MQTEIGYFRADSAPILWQNALRFISGNYLHEIGDLARMFALADAALADAQIACWDSKYFYNFWQPITAIRLGDQDGNAETAVDPNWQPLINTPNFPEYPSGHASVSGAVSRMLTLFFGTDELNFQMTTTNPNAQQKTRFSRVARRRRRSSTLASMLDSITVIRTALRERRGFAWRTGYLRTICGPLAIRALERSKLRALHSLYRATPSRAVARSWGRR